MAVLILRPIPMETASTLFTRTSDDLPVGRSLRSIYTTATLPPQHYSSTSVLRTLNLRIDRSIRNTLALLRRAATVQL
jgi:hypothetical protein